MNREPGPVRSSDWEFYLPEKQYLENRLSIMHFEMPLTTIWEKVLELGDLKKTHCQCQVHREDRETNLLYQLKLHNTCGNRELVNRVLQAQPSDSLHLLVPVCRSLEHPASATYFSMKLPPLQLEHLKQWNFIANSSHIFR